MINSVSITWIFRIRWAFSHAMGYQLVVLVFERHIKMKKKVQCFFRWWLFQQSKIPQLFFLDFLSFNFFTRYTVRYCAFVQKTYCFPCMKQNASGFLILCSEFTHVIKEVSCVRGQLPPKVQRRRILDTKYSIFAKFFAHLDRRTGVWKRVVQKPCPSDESKFLGEKIFAKGIFFSFFIHPSADHFLN